MARKKGAQSGTKDVELLPIMNLMAILIPVLLSSAEFIKLANIPVAFPSDMGAAAAPEAAPPPEAQKKLNLTIAVTPLGFYIASTGLVLESDDQAGGPTVPMTKVTKGGATVLDYDYGKLHELLVKVKQQFPDERAVMLSAEPETNFQVIINTMDALRSYQADNERKVLFPDIALAAGIG